MMSVDLRELNDDTNVDELKNAESAILYKHSNRCRVSWGTKREVERFVERGAAIPVYILDVIANRPLSLRLAEELGVRHESPQAILLRAGKAVKHMSHWQITATALEKWIGELVL